MIPGITSLAEHGRSLLRQLLSLCQTRLEMAGLAVEQEVNALSRELRPGLGAHVVRRQGEVRTRAVAGGPATLATLS